MELSDYDYELPADLIAQNPTADREASRMLVVRRSTSDLEDTDFRNLPSRLKRGDVLVLNNTKVFPARLFGVTQTGANVEVFLVQKLSGIAWEALARPARRLKVGKIITFGDSLRAAVTENLNDGRIRVEFEFARDFDEALDRVGETPLPPYIKRESGEPTDDRDRYQTVYAKHRGAIAAPTAGLHFTQAVLDEVRDRGVELAEITLHVGYGTFEPVRVTDLSQHSVMPERYEIGESSSEILNAARTEHRRIVAVGTTTTRALETSISKHGSFIAVSDIADLTVTPGYRFRAVDALLTNFHLPQSSLLILVSSFGGHDLIMGAYRHAVAARYRFYSYGDCMFIE